METSNERRLRKLIALCASTEGGYPTVANKAGLKPVYLEQVIKRVKLPPKKGDGSRSERGLGDPAARAIEEAFSLGRGWFDNDKDEAEMLSPREMELVGIFRQLEDENLQGVVMEGIRDAIEDRKRLAEKLRFARPSEAADDSIRGGSLHGGISQFGDIAAPAQAKRGKR